MFNRDVSIVSNVRFRCPSQEWLVRWLSLPGVVAPVVLLALYISASLLNPGFDQIGRTVSQLGVDGMAYPMLMNAGFIMVGISVLLFSFAVYIRFRRHLMAKLLWLTLVMYGVGVLMAGVFHAELDVMLISGLSEGMLHSSFAGMAILSLIVAMLAAADIFQYYPAWRRFFLPSVLMAAAIILLVLLFITGVVDRWLGIFELLFYTMALVWMWSVALRSFRLALDDG